MGDVLGEKIKDDLKQFELERVQIRAKIRIMEENAMSLNEKITYLKSLLEHSEESGESGHAPSTTENSFWPYNGEPLREVIRSILKEHPLGLHRKRIAKKVVQGGYTGGQGDLVKVLRNVSTLMTRHKEQFQKVGVGTYRLTHSALLTDSLVKIAKSMNSIRLDGLIGGGKIGGE